MEFWELKGFKIKELRAVQPLSFRNQEFNELYQIPTFREYLILVKELSQKLGKTIGVYPEIKHPDFTNALDFMRDKSETIQNLVLKELEPFVDTFSPQTTYIQSFDVSILPDLVTREYQTLYLANER